MVVTRCPINDDRQSICYSKLASEVYIRIISFAQMGRLRDKDGNSLLKVPCLLSGRREIEIQGLQAQP